MEETKKIFLKILLVSFLLFLLLFGVVVLRLEKGKKVPSLSQTPQEIKVEVTPTVTPFETPGRYFLKMEKERVRKGERFVLEVSFAAGGKIFDGSDVILKFDPNFLTPEENSIKVGEYFVHYPIKKVEKEEGIVRVSGYLGQRTTPLEEGEAINFCTLYFIAKAAGTTRIDFDFIPGKTNKTTLVEKDTSRNLLGGTEGIEIKIE